MEHLLALHEAFADFLLRGWDTLAEAKTTDRLLGSFDPDYTPRLEPLGRPYLKMQAWGQAIEEMVKTRRIDWERLAGIYAEFPRTSYEWGRAALPDPSVGEEMLEGEGQGRAEPDGGEALKQIGQRLRALLALGPPATVAPPLSSRSSQRRRKGRKTGGKTGRPRSLSG